jgi:hypothetical protein
VAPEAVKVVLPPVQIEGAVGVTDTVNEGVTVTVTVVVDEQPDPSIPVTVYVVVVAGFAVTVAPVVALRPVAGLQVYVTAPEAVNVVEPPVQIVGFAGVTASDVLPTFTVTVPVPVQPSGSVATTV